MAPNYRGISQRLHPSYPVTGVGLRSAEDHHETHAGAETSIGCAVEEQVFLQEWGNLAWDKQRISRYSYSMGICVKCVKKSKSDYDIGLVSKE